MTDDIREKAEEFAWSILSQLGYNFALSDVEGACKFLDHPELKESDKHNFHKWAEPYPRRCYCSAIGYTNTGRFYACEMSESYLKVMQSIYPDFRSKFKEPYVGKGVKVE